MMHCGDVRKSGSSKRVIFGRARSSHQGQRKVDLRMAKSTFLKTDSVRRVEEKVGRSSQFSITSATSSISLALSIRLVRRHSDCLIQVALHALKMTTSEALSAMPLHLSVLLSWLLISALVCLERARCWQ